MGKTIKLTEAELHGLVQEAIKNVFESQDLDEGWMDYFKSVGRDAKSAAQQGYNAAANKVKQTAQNIGNNIQQGYNNVKQGIQNVHNRALDAKAIGDIPNAIKVLDNIKARKLINGRQLSMVNDAITILNNLLAQTQGQAQ